VYWVREASRARVPRCRGRCLQSDGSGSEVPYFPRRRSRASDRPAAGASDDLDGDRASEKALHGARRRGAGKRAGRRRFLRAAARADRAADVPREHSLSAGGAVAADRSELGRAGVRVSAAGRSRGEGSAEAVAVRSARGLAARSARRRRLMYTRASNLGSRPAPLLGVSLMRRSTRVGDDTAPNVKHP
jgi:hypothetical protein